METDIKPPSVSDCALQIGHPRWILPTPSINAEGKIVKKLIVLLMLGGVMVVGDTASGRATPNLAVRIQKKSRRAENYYGLIGLLCLLGLAGLRRKKSSASPIPVTEDGAEQTNT